MPKIHQDLTKAEFPQLIQIGEHVLHSGRTSDFKLDCDALSDEDIEACAYLLSKRVLPFSRVVGIPRGGLRLAEAMEPYRNPDAHGHVLVVDDVWTTGLSMQTERGKVFDAGSRMVEGAVIFARTPINRDGVVALFTLSPERAR